MVVYGFGNSHIWSVIRESSDKSDVMIEDDLPGGHLIRIWKVGDTGATAYGLRYTESRTRSRESVLRHLAERTEESPVLFLVFGEVDITEHIGRHGDIRTDCQSALSGLDSLLETVRETYPQIRNVIIASSIPHHSRFRPDQIDRIREIEPIWESELQNFCAERKCKYLDWYGPLRDHIVEVGEENVFRSLEPNERHLSTSCRDLLVRILTDSLSLLS